MVSPNGPRRSQIYECGGVRQRACQSGLEGGRVGDVERQGDASGSAWRSNGGGGQGGWTCLRDEGRCAQGDADDEDDHHGGAEALPEVINLQLMHADNLFPCGT